MRSKVFVVEGKNDYAKFKSINPDWFILTTNGSEISESTLQALIKFDQTHDIVLCLDPDAAGTKIRHFLSQRLRHVEHVFLNQEQARNKNGEKIGFEHATNATIIEALKHLQKVQHHSTSNVTLAFLYEHGYLGQPMSRTKRQHLSEALHLGHVNGKNLLMRLHQFNYKMKDILEVMK